MVWLSFFFILLVSILTARADEQGVSKELKVAWLFMADSHPSEQSGLSARRSPTALYGHAPVSTRSGRRSCKDTHLREGMFFFSNFICLRIFNRLSAHVSLKTTTEYLSRPAFLFFIFARSSSDHF